MEARRELELLITPPRAPTLREQRLKITLANVRSEGHRCVDIREHENQLIFFCSLCPAKCYNETVLFDHVKGKRHGINLSAAKATLFGPNPWPFVDGEIFFDTIGEKEKQSDDEQNRKSQCHNDDSLATVKYDKGSIPNTENFDGGGRYCDIVIPQVLMDGKIVDLKVRFNGLAQISARLYVKDGKSNQISKIWCEWLGEECKDMPKALDHDFAIVTFSYFNDLGRIGFLESCVPDAGAKRGRKRKKPVSDTEDFELLRQTFIRNKTVRRDIRRKQRAFADKTCAICQHKLLPGKDVAAILNTKTGRFACSSRNIHGAFHVFHTSCLVHWFLGCEHSIIRNQSNCPEEWGKSIKINTDKQKKRRKVVEKTYKPILSVLCPECQGTGVGTLERPSTSLTQVYIKKMEMLIARKAWMISPEKLQNCSTGFYFPTKSGITEQEEVSPLKLVRFYRG